MLYFILYTNKKRAICTLHSFKFSYRQSALVLLLFKEYDVPRVARHSYVQIREEWEKFSCILSSAEFFLDILQEVEVRCNGG